MSELTTERTEVDRLVYRLGWLMIAIATVMHFARILGITAPHGELPFLSANDRSRWCAIAALTEEGRWEIDHYLELLDSKGKSKIWNTIDMVRHRGEDGQDHSYSSKPPLLTLMYAAVCKPITWICGRKLSQEPFLIGRLVMIVANLIPFLVWWIWMHRWMERNIPEPWTRAMLLCTILCGTFLSTFVATLNNHIHGALFFSISLALLMQVIRESNQGQSSAWWIWIVSGLVAGLTVVCELPALGWAVVAAIILGACDWKRTLIGYGVGAAVIAIAFFATNYWAHGDFRPPYAHRGLGPVIVTVDNDAKDNEAPQVEKLVASLDASKYKFGPETTLGPARLENVLQLADESSRQRVAVVVKGNKIELCEWDDWYDYPNSYWLPKNKKGVDQGEPNRWLYMFHFLIGHHGIFSLTPIWLWSMVGAVIWAMKISPREHGLARWIASESSIALGIAASTLACVVFYVSRDIVDRNYAGVCCGFRWMFWLIPAWIWLAIPALERSSQSKWVRAVFIAFLMLSVLSATIPWSNPWTHPWPYRLLMWQYPDTYK